MKNRIFVDLDNTLIVTYVAPNLERLREAAERRLALFHGMPRGTPEEERARTMAQHGVNLCTSRYEIAASGHPLPGADYWVSPRPGAVLALEAFAGLGEVHLFTAAEYTYAEEVLNAVRLRTQIKAIHSLRDDVADPTDTQDDAWVLVDDLPAYHKLAYLGGNADRHLVQVTPFEFGMSRPVTSLVDYVPEVYRKLAAQH